MYLTYYSNNQCVFVSMYSYGIEINIIVRIIIIKIFLEYIYNLNIRSNLLKVRPVNKWWYFDFPTEMITSLITYFWKGAEPSCSSAFDCRLSHSSLSARTDRLSVGRRLFSYSVNTLMYSSRFERRLSTHS